MPKNKYCETPMIQLFEIQTGGVYMFFPNPQLAHTHTQSQSLKLVHHLLLYTARGYILLLQCACLEHIDPCRIRAVTSASRART